MADTQTFQPPTQEHKHTLQPEPKPKHLTITQTSLSLPNDTVSESQFTVQTPISQTLALPNDRDFDCPSFSELLEGVIAANESVGFEGQFEMSHQEVLASVTAKATQARAQMELQAASAFHSTELSPVTQSKLSVPSSMPITQKSPSAPQDYTRMLELDQQNRSYQDKACVREVDLQNSTSHDTKPAHITMKNPTIDGYNWRKYGQKQVKSTESSRSYYKCTYSDCHAKKKVQHCDHSGHVTEIVYKGRHNHDPPQKIRCNRSRSSVSSAGPVVGSGTVNPPVQKRDDSDSFTSRRQLWQESLPTPELVWQNSSGSDGNAGIKVEEENGEEPESMQRMDTPEPTLSPPQQKQPRSSGSDEIAGIEAEEEHGDEPRPKRRMKERGVAYSVPQFKTIKEPKIVVHAAGDAGISCDGYRWRKYGQKIVKGTPHPRSYYRCTSAGCPVRKHVERATDDTAAIIITYEGKHDHDMPVPKKRHGSPSAALLIAAAAAMNNVQLKKTETLPKRRSSNSWSVGMEGDLTCEKALELGGEKALESARTLLSIGIELKPC